MIDDATFQPRMQKIGELVARLDSEETARARELLQAVMDLHGEALDRIVQRLRDFGDSGEALIDSLTADPLISSVLLLYGLHPLDFETRVRRAVDRLGPVLRSRGAFAELLGFEGGAVRIRLRGVDGAATAREVRSLIEEEFYAAVPDAGSLTLVGLEKFAPPDFVPLALVAHDRL